MNDQANGTVGLSSAQTTAAATTTKAPRGTSTANPALAAAARIEKIIADLPDEATQKRVARITVEEFQAKGLI